MHGTKHAWGRAGGRANWGRNLVRTEVRLNSWAVCSLPVPQNVHFSESCRTMYHDLKPRIGHNIGFHQRPIKHIHEVDHVTERMSRGVELENARILVQNDVEVAVHGEVLAVELRDDRVAVLRRVSGLEEGPAVCVRKQRVMYR